MNTEIDYYFHLETVEPAYKSVDELAAELALRERIGECSIMGQFAEVLELTKHRRDLINSFRPSSSRLWTPLHQAEYLGDQAAVKQLIAAGAKHMFSAEGFKPEHVRAL